MADSFDTPARSYAPGIGDAVANRSVNRSIVRALQEPETVRMVIPRRDDLSLDAEVDAYAQSNGYAYSDYHVREGDEFTVEIDLNVTGKRETETWADVAERVATGNAALILKHRKGPGDFDAFNKEFEGLHHHLRQASLLMSGRHLQHGDRDQPERNMEVFTNCSTAAASFLSFYLLLNGSGVGRSYDDDMMVVDWRNMPLVIPVIDGHHPDCLSGEIDNVLSRRDAEHLYRGRDVTVWDVPDSREGWAKAIELMEQWTFRKWRDKVLILDFSGVRERGAPIKGMQNRPASGPGPLMAAIKKISWLREAGQEPWFQSLYIDHYAAECVLVGGARRAARMATKTWRDFSVLDFIQVKRGGFLWSANNSVTVDAEFWSYVLGDHADSYGPIDFVMAQHAQKVFDALCEAAYYDGTGEPGIINVDRLVQNDEGLNEAYHDGNFVQSEKYQLEPVTLELMRRIAQKAMGKTYNMITNPCGEIALLGLGGYCVIADTVPYHAANDEDAEDSMRVAVRALMRVNLMDSLYKKEVARTNRIGVGFTGLHEYAYSRFGYGFRDLIDEQKSLPFWRMMSRFARAVDSEARSYAKELGVAVPHTMRTVKPAGTTSKLFGLTEGVHLPAMREYLRWVQFRNDDPRIEEYRAQGYPIKKLRTYNGTTIVGFPTRPEICQLGMGDKLVTAAEATPEEQYQWLRLLEKWWIVGCDEQDQPLSEDRGNQVSYTLKYNPKEVSFEEFKRTLALGQSSVRCCSVMPQADTSAYEYLPEQAVTKHEYERIVEAINDSEQVEEDIGLEHVDCSSGACPIDFRTSVAA